MFISDGCEIVILKHISLVIWPERLFITEKNLMLSVFTNVIIAFSKI